MKASRLIGMTVCSFLSLSVWLVNRAPTSAKELHQPSIQWEYKATTFEELQPLVKTEYEGKRESHKDVFGRTHYQEYGSWVSMPKNKETVLNRLGRDGWELCGIETSVTGAGQAAPGFGGGVTSSSLLFLKRVKN